LRRQHPEIRIKLIGEKRAASLSRREADVALRLSRPSEPGLIARKIGSFRFSLYGSPVYLKETPRHAFSFIGYDDSMDGAPQQVWLKRLTRGGDLVLRTSDLENQAAAARTGLGLAVLPHFLGDPDPALERYEITPAPPRRDVWLLIHRDLRRTPLVRAVMDFVTECVSSKR
jgi:DNA-binding transcriptional LysR family regulator